MIDPHVHLRDEEWAYKETIANGLWIAEHARMSAVFDMPNLPRPVTTEERVLERFALASAANSPVVYATYVGVTSEPEQLKRAVDVTRKYKFKEGDRTFVSGLKMFAGRSVGDLSVVEEDEQHLVYETLAREGYDGVITVHCEKESLIKKGPDGKQYFDPKNPITHCTARPPEAELESIRDQLLFSEQAGYKGHLHIAHVSLADSAWLVKNAKKAGRRVSCEVTPHHCLLLSQDMNRPDGILDKVNPPLRSYPNPKTLLLYLYLGMIDCVATDHAPHSRKDKTEPPYLSGFPGLPFYPHFLKYLRKNNYEMNFDKKQIIEITHTNIENIFGIHLPVSNKPLHYDLRTGYEVDVYKDFRTS
ncbi:MAG: dihydroorotase [Candidatus Aenigmatarchaeota archaeon]